ncbi:MAG: DNA polymerase III subunit delta' [Rhodospirillaceae bacterium]|nr:DNA polymerase III subunit delta' [Rhodospirillaceae bacterium]
MVKSKKPIDIESEPYPRPRKNPFLTGHDDAEKKLLESFNSGRMHHAWLISGPRGIGKATLAYRFARHILSHGEGVNNQPIVAPPDLGAGLFGAEDVPEENLPQTDNGPLYLGENTPVFQRVASGGHADLFSIERRHDEKSGKLKTVIGVDDVRGIGHFLSMTPAEGGWRVVVVDAVDEMNPNAANALLKVLEEPPSRAILLLVCHNSANLLPTIRSRCTKMAMRPLNQSTVISLIEKYAPDLNSGDARHLAQLCDGSIGRALNLAEAGGLDLWKETRNLLSSLPGVDVRALHSLAEKVSRAGAEESYNTVTSLVRWWLEGLILVISGKDAGSSMAIKEDVDMMASIGAKASLDRWFYVWEKINNLVFRANAVNLDRKQVVLDIFLSLENAAKNVK